MFSYNYNVNWNKLLKWSLPFDKRRTTIFAWLQLLISSIRKNHTAFLEYRKQVLEEINYTGQVIYLEKLLNDKFDYGPRRIYIQSVLNTQARTYLFHKSESKPPRHVFHKSENQAPYYLIHRAEYAGNYDFIVWVPMGLSFDSNVMKAYINKYKLAGKRYIIYIFNPASSQVGLPNPTP